MATKKDEMAEGQPENLGEPFTPPVDDAAHEPITDPEEAAEKGYFGTVSKASEAQTEVADLRNDKTFSDLEKSDQGR